MLRARIQPDCSLFPFPLRSRLHLLPRKAPAGGTNFYVKRDDELGGVFCNGSKLRKYASLLPALITLRQETNRYYKEERLPAIGVVGGEDSNHLLSLTTLLLEQEFQVQPILYERTRKAGSLNSGFFNLLLSSSEAAPPDHPVKAPLRVPWPIAKNGHSLREWLIKEEGIAILKEIYIDAKQNPQRDGIIKFEGGPQLLTCIPEGAFCAEAVLG